MIPLIDAEKIAAQQVQAFFANCGCRTLPDAAAALMTLLDAASKAATRTLGQDRGAAMLDSVRRRNVKALAEDVEAVGP